MEMRYIIKQPIVKLYVNSMVLQVVVVEYNPQWPSFYEQEKEQILSLIADNIIAIEHIGSTSVPGLGAKPVIDMMVGLRSLTEAANCIAPLQSLGYEYVPEFEEIIPERRFFRKYDSEYSGYHVHVVETTSQFWEDLILFRDRLIKYPQIAQEYYQLKQVLAEKYRRDRHAYVNAKNSFIQAAIAAAKKEAIFNQD
jgi:GrpB-like predicted nucleotidyltransferase (UPF0157 family)